MRLDLAIARGARRRAGLIAALVCLLAAPALASVDSELSFHKGVVAYGQQRYDEARTLFEKVLELDPNDTVAIHYLALIAQKQGDRARARELIERGLAIDPDDADLLTDLGVLQLESGLTAEARGTFDKVLAVRPDDARTQLFAGIGAYRAGAYAEATPHLERAVALDPNLAMQARYYAGLSEAFLGNLPVAEGAFDDVANQSPQSPLAQSAQRLRNQIRQPEPERPWTFQASAGGEYDSNPLLAGVGIPQDDDYRGVWRARGTYRVFEREGFTLSTGAEGYWSIHHDEDEVDLQSYLGFLNASYALGPVLFGLQYDFIYTFIDFDDEFRMANRVTPSLSVREGDFGLTQLYYQYQKLDFFNEPQTGALALDGHEQFVGVSQYFFLPAPISYIRLGALGDFQNSRGTEFQYQGYELFTGTSVALPFDTQFDVLYRFADRYFDHDSFFPATPNLPVGPTPQHQHATIHRVTLELIKAITPHIDIGLAGSLGFRRSNVPVFDYNRYIGGGYVTYRF